jgi:hypothetical protein
VEIKMTITFKKNQFNSGYTVIKEGNAIGTVVKTESGLWVGEMESASFSGKTRKEVEVPEVSVSVGEIIEVPAVGQLVEVIEETEQLDFFSMFDEVEETVEPVKLVAPPKAVELFEVIQTYTKEQIVEAVAPVVVAEVAPEPVVTPEVIEVPETIVKTREAKMSTRGIYVQDVELLQTVFQVGTYFDFVINAESKTVTVIPTEVKGKNTVSKRKMKDVTKPVIDIRRKNVLETFNGCENLVVTIFENRIEIAGQIA